MCVAGASYLAWLLKLERDSHDATRRQISELGEKRLQLHVENVALLKDLTLALHELRDEVRRKRRL